jgi:peptidoglycan hydrolase CwlO-like protein
MIIFITVYLCFINLWFVGGLSTLIGVCPLATINSYIMHTFAKMMFLVVSLGIVHGLVILPVFLTKFASNQDIWIVNNNVELEENPAQFQSIPQELEAIPQGLAPILEELEELEPIQEEGEPIQEELEPIQEELEPIQEDIN